MSAVVRRSSGEPLLERGQRFAESFPRGLLSEGSLDD